MGHAGDRRLRTGPNVGRGAGDRAGGRQSAEQRRQDVRDPLCGQLDVGIVTVARHPIRDDGGEQRFDRAEHGDGQGRREEAEHQVQPHGRQVIAREALTARHRTGCRWSRRACRPQTRSPIRRAGRGCCRECVRESRRSSRIVAIVLNPSSVAAADAVPAEAVSTRDAPDELPGHCRRLQPEQVLDLRAGDQHADAVGEADHDRTRNVLHRRAQTGDAEQDQDHAGEQRAREQAIEAVGGDDARHHHDEGAGWTADLDARSAEGGNREPGDDGAIDAVLRRHAGRDGERHGQRERHQADRDPGDEIAGSVPTEYPPRRQDTSFGAGRARVDMICPGNWPDTLLYCNI